MGSFNTVCALSHVSMDGDPAVFVPLVRGHFAKGTPINLNGDTAIVSNEGPYAFFVALCPPLFGRMTDYGRLEDVEDTPTARAVARAFGKSPQAFLDACGESQTASGFVYHPSEGYVPIEERVGGCFVHRRVWDEMSSRLTDEWGRDGRSLWLSSATLYPRVLTMMGFEQKGEDLRRDRYRTRWVHPLFPRLTLWSDKRWCLLEWPGMRANEGQYHFSPKDIARVAVAHGGGPSRFPWQTVKLLRATPTHAADHDEHLEQVARHRDLFVRTESLIATKDRGYLSDPGGGSMFSYGLDPGFLDRFWPEVSTGGLRDELVAWWTFVGNMAACNQVLMPGYNGYQCGNHYAHRDLARLTTDILDEKIAKGERSRRDTNRAVRRSRG